MCGRFSLSKPPVEIADAFEDWVVPEEIEPRHNIAPQTGALVAPNDGRRRMDVFLWGLVPSWAKDPGMGARMINARAETLAEKPSFQNAFRRHRCLVVADGFYEWRKTPGQKQKTPYYIRMKSGKPFGFAGLWECWHSEFGDEMLSFTIITTEPNELMKPIHNRMPVILGAEARELWLDPAERKPKELTPLLRPYPAEAMEAYPVSTRVNNPRNEGPECVERAPDAPPETAQGELF